MSEQFKIKAGYKLVYRDNLDNYKVTKRGRGWIHEHIVIMSQHIKRPLESDEVVHHLDEIKTNNSLSNLVLLSKGEHSFLHSILNRSEPIDHNKEYDVTYTTIESIVKLVLPHLDKENKNKILKHYSNLMFKYISIENIIKHEDKEFKEIDLHNCNLKGNPDSEINNMVILEKLYATYSYTDLGKILNMSANGIKKRFKRCGIEIKRKYSSNNDIAFIDNEENLKDLLSKHSVRQITKIYGYAHETIKYYVRKYNINFEEFKTQTTRKVSQYDKAGNFITTFNSVREAEESLGIPMGDSHISGCCLGKRKTCKGYIWKYAD